MVVVAGAFAIDGCATDSDSSAIGAFEGLPIPDASQTIWLVTKATDSALDAGGAKGELRYAMNFAPEGTTINFWLPQKSIITLAARLPRITKDLTIDGLLGRDECVTSDDGKGCLTIGGTLGGDECVKSDGTEGKGCLTIDGAGAALAPDGTNQGYRAFFIESGTVRLQNLKIQNAVARGGNGGAPGGGGGLGAGGCVFVDNGDVTIANSVLSNCQAVGGTGGANNGNAGGGGGGGLDEDGSPSTGSPVALKNGRSNYGPNGGAGGGTGGSGGSCTAIWDNTVLQVSDGNNATFGGGGGGGATDGATSYFNFQQQGSGNGGNGGFGGGGGGGWIGGTAGPGGGAGGSGQPYQGSIQNNPTSGGGGGAFGPAAFVHSGKLHIVASILGDFSTKAGKGGAAPMVTQVITASPYVGSDGTAGTDPFYKFGGSIDGAIWIEADHSKKDVSAITGSQQ